uniref:Uncharacterized protein n=1 Tax=Glossina palpalis gambiensis TaxID=67801 RepID=A0A1B0B3K4_9MUSC
MHQWCTYPGICGSRFQPEQLSGPSRNQLKQQPFPVNIGQDPWIPIISAKLKTIEDHDNMPCGSYENSGCYNVHETPFDSMKFEEQHSIAALVKITMASH